MSSGLTYHQAMSTPSAGNAYFILAPQYAAAVLNGLNGASVPPDVQSAMGQAAALFAGQGSNDTTLSKVETKVATSLAATLGAYNNGLLGPGHCTE